MVRIIHTPYPLLLNALCLMYSGDLKRLLTSDETLNIAERLVNTFGIGGELRKNDLLIEGENYD